MATDSVAEDALERKLVQLYDDYRTARMNQKYYARQLRACTTLCERWEIFLAIATSGAVGSWALWQFPVGVYVWSIAGGVAVVLSVIKPFLRLTDHVQRYSQLWCGIGDYYSDLDALVKEVAVEKMITQEMDRALVVARTRVHKLDHIYDPVPKKQLLEDCFEEVKAEIPSSSLWMPSQRRNSPGV
jgi:hypothetical protein